MSASEDLQRAEHAKALLSDKMLKDALESIEKEIMERWEACPARDREGREELWIYYKTAKKFRGMLQGAIESGKVAEFELERKRSVRDQILSMVRR